MNYKKLDNIKDDNKRLEAKTDMLYYGLIETDLLNSFNTWFIVTVILLMILVILSFISKTNLIKISYYPFTIMVLSTIATLSVCVYKHFRIKKRYFKK